MSLSHAFTDFFARHRSNPAAAMMRPVPGAAESPAVAVRHCLLALRDLVHLRGSEPIDPGRVSVANDLAAILGKIDFQAFSALKWRVIESYEDQIVVAEYMAMADAKISRHGTETERSAWQSFQATRRPELLLNLVVSFMSPAQVASSFMEDRLDEAGRG